RWGPPRSCEGGNVFLGYTLLAGLVVALVLARRRIGAGRWLALGAALLLVAAGRIVIAGGRGVGRLPFSDLVLAPVPLAGGMRCPARLTSVVALCWAVAAAIGLSALHRRLAPAGARWPTAVALLLAALPAAEHLLPRAGEWWTRRRADPVHIPAYWD